MKMVMLTGTEPTKSANRRHIIQVLLMHKTYNCVGMDIQIFTMGDKN